MTVRAFDPLPWDAPLDGYQRQAAQLLEAHAAGHAAALALLHRTLPRFLDDTVTWLPRPITQQEIRDTPLDLDDTRLAVARLYSFLDWDALAALVTEVRTARSPIRSFERAVDAVVTGKATQLREMLREHPDLVRERSTRVTCHDPPVHGATLVHYLGANGVEGHRQKSPPNAVAIGRLLLEAGADADALAGMYGGRSPTLSMLVSSTPPHKAGVQVPLTNLLVDYGANVEGAGEGTWRSPLMTALVFDFLDAAEALVARGARVDDVVKAAGLGREAEVSAFLPTATADERHRAFAMATIGGQLGVTQLLLAAGEDPNRFNPSGFHSHGTPLHHAAAGGKLALVELLVAHGARTDIEDSLWKGTPIGWAQHEGRQEVVDYLQRLGGASPPS